MAIFGVSFRVSEADGKAAYDAAYKAINDAIIQEGGSSVWRHGTTSFRLLESSKAAGALLSALYKPTAVRLSDEILVINLSAKSYAFWPSTGVPTALTSLMAKR